MQNRGLIIDDLTGVLNRQSFIQELDLNINTEQSGFIITIAFDDFKFMNETLEQKWRYCTKRSWKIFDSDT